MDDTRESVPRWTPGPWRVNPDNLTEVWFGPDGYSDGCDIYFRDEERARSDAQVISASPDFAAACTPDRLDALESLIADGEIAGKYDSEYAGDMAVTIAMTRALLTDLRAAMNKATGGRP